MKNKYVKYGIIAVILVVLGLVSKTLFFSSEDTKIVLETTQLSTGSISNMITATGTIEPVDKVEVGTQVSGLVSKIYVDYNSTVKKGDIIAELDKTNLLEAVASARASYNSAKNEVNYYQQNFDRQQNMFKSGVISTAEFELASYQLENAKQTLTQRKTALSQAQTDLSYANIYSPIDGIILTRDVEEGQTVAASYSTPTLFTIAKDLTKMQVEASVDEADIGSVKVGQRVMFTVDSYPREEFEGAVSQVRLGATTESNVVTYTVIIDADNPDLKLKPGLTATISIYVEELQDIPVLSAAAINFSPDNATIQLYYEQEGIKASIPKIEPDTGTTKHVWIKMKDGSLQQKAIETGSSDGINYYVKNGLSKNDKVITSLVQQNGSELAAADDESSPFMPKPPGSNKK